MTSSPIAIKDANAANLNLAADLTSGVTTPVHLEDAAQRTALLAALAATQTVTALSLPLPTGASTSALQSTANATLSAIVNALAGASTAALQGTGNVTLASILAALGSTSTAAGQATGNATLASILSALSGLATAGAQTAGNTTLASIVTALANMLKVDVVVPSSVTNRSCYVGTSATVLMPANPTRRGYRIQNQDTTATIFISELGTATTTKDCLGIGPGDFYDSHVSHCETGAISIISTATNTAVFAREW